MKKIFIFLLVLGFGGGNAQTVLNQNQVPTGKSFPIANGSIFLSHSIGAGYNQTGGTITAYPYFTANFSGVNSYNNYSISGQGVRNQYWKYVQQNDASPKLVPISVMLGINEIRIGTDTTRRFKHIRAGFRAIAAAHFTNSLQFYKQGSGTVNSNVASSNASNFFTPTIDTLADWSSRAFWYAANDSSNRGANFWIKKNITANETVTISNVNGKNIAIGTWACDGSRTIMSRFSITVDGASYGTYDPNGQTYITGALNNPDGNSYFGNGYFQRTGIVNDAITINNLKDTAHTVVLTFLDAGTIGAWDYIAGLKQPQAAVRTPLYFWDIGYCNATGYNYQGYSFTQAQIDSANLTSIRDLQGNFPNYPIIRVNTNKYFDPNNSTHIQPDGLHPTAVGNSFIAQAYIDLIDEQKIQSQYYSVGQGLTNVNGTLNNSLITGKAGGQTIIGGTQQRDNLTLRASNYNASPISTDSAFIFRNGNATGFNYLGSINNNGLLDIGSIKTGSINATSINNVVGGTVSLGGFGTTSLTASNIGISMTGGASIVPYYTTQAGLKVTGKLSQTADLIQIDPNGVSAGSYLKVNASGTTTINSLNINSLTSGASTDSIVTVDGSGNLRKRTVADVIGITTAMPQLEFKATSAVTTTGTTSITLTCINGTTIPTGTDFSHMHLYFKGLRQIRDIGVSTRDFKITSSTTTTVVIDFYTTAVTKTIAVDDYFTMDIVK